MTAPLLSGIDPAPGLALAEALHDWLAANTADPPGFSRDTYGSGENKAHDRVAATMAELGCEIARDAGGNLFVTWPGEDRSRRVLIGSHLDSQRHGGNFDGASGVIMGLAAQAALIAAGRRLPVDLTVAAWRGEESCWFPVSYVGSRMGVGQFPAEALDEVVRTDTGRTLRDHMIESGADPDGVARGETWLNPAEVVAYLEPHIEQGPILIAEGEPLGIVTGIRGSYRLRQMRCTGRWDHSGAVPRAYRADALLATVDLIHRLEAVWRAWEAEGRDIVMTVGELTTDPRFHAFAKVPGQVDIVFEIRSTEPETLARMAETLPKIAEEVERERGVAFTLGPDSGSRPAAMDPRLIHRAREVAATRGIAHRVMGSGAAHDAAVMAQAGIPSLMLFIRNANGSHNPDEAMDMADFATVFTVLLDMLADPDRPLDAVLSAG